MRNYVPWPLYVVHNAFRKYFEAYGDNAEELAIDLFQWFKSHSTDERESPHEAPLVRENSSLGFIEAFRQW